MTIETMPSDQFWSLVALCGAPTSPEECDVAVETLGEALRQLQPEEVAAFECAMSEQFHRAYTWGLWGAAFVLNGGCSDDGFEYFRGWLLLQGREVFEAALADPDSLAGVVEQGDLECEGVLYLPFRVYEHQTGMPLIPPSAGPAEPIGERWDEDALAERFPRLTSKFG